MLKVTLLMENVEMSIHEVKRNKIKNVTIDVFVHIENPSKISLALRSMFNMKLH